MCCDAVMWGCRIGFDVMTSMSACFAFGIRRRVLFNYSTGINDDDNDNMMMFTNRYSQRCLEC